LAACNIVRGKLVAIADDGIHNRVDVLSGLVGVSQTEDMTKFV
jgi:hypothetical protein